MKRKSLIHKLGLSAGWAYVALGVFCASMNSCKSTQGLLTAFTSPTETAAVAPIPAPDGTPSKADPVVVNAEKITSVGNRTFNLIVHLEHDNKAAFAKVSPSIHPFVNNIRRNGIGWIRTADNLKEAYKKNRNAESKANLLTALAVVSNATNSAKDYLAAAGFGANP